MYLHYDDVKNINITMEVIQHLIPKFVTKEDCESILIECNRYVRNKKFEMQNYMCRDIMTSEEFGNDLISNFEKIISQYTQKNNYKYMDRLLFLRDAISKNNMPEETEILSSMIEEFDVSKHLNKSTMLYYNKLHKLIYGETNE